MHEEELATLLRLRSSASLPSRIAVIGNYLPRQCGIATFTTDLCDAIGAEYGAAQLLAVPVNDPGSQYSYPARVRFELMEGDPSCMKMPPTFLTSAMSIWFLFSMSMAFSEVRPAATSCGCCGA